MKIQSKVGFVGGSVFAACIRFVAVGLFVALVSGCATQAMKGTPFYTGEWTERTGAVEDRVALWPLVYYREPALSVLWPIFEKSPDHFAMRPVYSVQGLERNRPVHHLLWPLGRFDRHNQSYRFFPVFWGKDHVVVFPLYWHLDQPFGGRRGQHALFPLWIYSRYPMHAENSHHRLHVVWPLARFEKGPRRTSARVFPVFWARKDASGASHFKSLPYGRVRNAAGDEKQDWLLPLYVRNQSPHVSSLHTLLYGHWLEEDVARRYALLGLWYAKSSENHTKQRLFPVYWYNKRPAGESLVSPLFMRGVNNETEQRWHVVVPLYYRSTSPYGNALYTLLGGGSRGADGSGRIVSLLYMQRKDEDGCRVDVVPPLLSWRSMQADRTNWHIVGPLSRLSFGDQAQPSYVLPVFYRNPESGTLMSPLHQRGGTEKSERRWHASVPLYLRVESDAASAWITPLGAMTRNADGGRRTITPLYVHLKDGEQSAFRAVPPLLSWQLLKQDGSDFWLAMGLARFGTGEDSGASHVLPIYYRNASRNTLLTLLWSHWDYDRSHWQAVPPLLSWRQVKESGAQKTRVLGGLVGRETDVDGDPVRSHALPLFYRDASKNTLLTPLWSTWEGEHARVHAVPPLLSWRWTKKDGSRDTRVLGGIAGRKADADGDYESSYVFPLYYRHPGNNTLLTLLWSAWRDEDTRVHAIPPLLSWRRTQEDGASSTRVLGGLGARDTDSDGKHVRSHLIPLYSANSAKNRFVSPAYARWQDEAGARHDLLPPLLSWRTVDARSNRSVRVAAGLYGQTRTDDGTLHDSHLFPLYAYRKNQHFYTPIAGRDASESGRFRYWLTPLVGTYRNERSGSWVWPLYNYRKNRETGHHDSSFLLWGYHRTGEYNRHTGFFPVFWHRHIERDTVEVDEERPWTYHMRRTIHENSLSLLLLYHRREQVTQYGPRSAPLIEGERYEQRALHTNRLFPLWNFRREEYGEEDAGPMRRTGHVLWRLYDHETEHGTEDQPHEYVRRRILWHAWHYERLNGQVSVDSLPFITYDSRPDGFRKFTFLWRGFRYENDPEDGRKIDFLFIPIRR